MNRERVFGLLILFKWKKKTVSQIGYACADCFVRFSRHIWNLHNLPFNRSKIKLNLIAVWSLAFSRASFDSELPLVRRDNSLCTDWPLHILSLILDLKLSVNVTKVYLYLHSQNARTWTFSSVINPAGIKACQFRNRSMVTPKMFSLVSYLLTVKGSWY